MYYLDTNILSFAFKETDAAVSKHIKDEPFEDIAISSLMLEELLKGQWDEINSCRTIAQSKPNLPDKQTVADAYEFLGVLVKKIAPFQFADYPNEAEIIYSKFSRASKRHPFDARLIAHAKVTGATIVTDNTDDFDAIRKNEGLKDVNVVNWASRATYDETHVDDWVPGETYDIE